MELNTIWVAIGLGVIGLVVCSLVWLGRTNRAGKSYGPETAIGLGMLEAQRHAQGQPLDSGGAGASDTGGAGAGSAGGDGGGSQP